jgi:hypothetical protein
MSKQAAISVGIVAALAGMVFLTVFFGDRTVGDARASGEKSRPAKSQDVGLQPKRFGSQRKSATLSAYVPTIPLKSQLSELARDAEKGGAYSACILASAFDVCHRELESPVVFDYPPSYFSRMSEEQAESFSLSAANFEYRVSRMCQGIEAADARERAQWLLKAAIAGHSGSMSRLLSLRDFSADGREPPGERIAAAFRGNAERMLNRAAEAGEIRAIEQVSFAYLTGNISNPLGSVSIRADELKALAASQALALIRDESKKRKIPFYDFDDREIRANIESRIAQMRREDLARFSGFVSLYYDAYWNNYDRKQDKIGPMSELPEESCETMMKDGARDGARKDGARTPGARTPTI